jgi:transposase
MMTIDRALEGEILRLHHAEHWPVGTISRHLSIHHSVVRRVLAQAGIPIPKVIQRASIADPFVPFIAQTLQRYPRLCASRLYVMVRERGYRGGPDHFRAVVARLRPRPPVQAYLRLRTLIGEQAQVDWGHFGSTTIGRAERALMAFVMVLSYSRHIFLRFYLNAAMGNFLRGHVDGFTFFNGVARTLLYDNLKSAVLERRADAIHFNPMLLDLAAHYRFAPKPVNVARGNEKGRVERAIRFIRERFFAARAFKDIDDLNTQALQWCLGEAADRPCPEDQSRSVRQCFAEEQPGLLTLPGDAFPTEERVEGLIARKTPYLRFDLNDYSIPHTHVGVDLQILASLNTVRILNGTDLIAQHPRSFDRGQQVEDPQHVQALVDYKRAARAHRAIDRLHQGAACSRAFFALAAQHGVNLGALTRGLLEILDTHGATDLQRAMQAALAEGSAHLKAVHHFIDAHRAQRGESPLVRVRLPNNPRVRELTVRAHDLREYEKLTPATSVTHAHDPLSTDCTPAGPFVGVLKE